jgi:hypothetical protein
MSDAYRGEEEAERARLVELHEELAKRRSHLAELDIQEPLKNAVDAPNNGRPLALALAPVALLGYCFAAAIAHGEIFVSVILAPILALAAFALTSRGQKTMKKFQASMPEHVDEFKNPEPLEPAKKQRVLTPEEAAEQKREIEKRLRACDEIEREIADAESLLVAAEVERETRR